LPYKNVTGYEDDGQNDGNNPPLITMTCSGSPHKPGDEYRKGEEKQNPNAEEDRFEELHSLVEVFA
jgi:hypothetical protein